MEPHERYEIIEQIAQGDFATVYRARDKELGREVAIKQIHDQFLGDPQKLERYWQEAQLLATLEHPYIMTIYDIVRDRGWLVLELMQGSLPQKLAGNPVDLEDLRLTIIYMLHALDFLQKNGIIHGDVKPSNLLLDKLGDFGIARRITGDDGSVVKGTTKYMAPEVLSDQFGPVGPHSDLYSLGFAAYELMCGEHFDTLFPGLNMYGRDQQIAWMMWHSALDRRLPDIHRVLQGVPDDLACVVQKLTEKDPAKRYKTANEVIAELRAKDQGDETQIASEIAEVEQKQKNERRKRMTLFGAVAVSLCLSIAMVFIPSESTPKDKPPPQRQLPKQGIIREIDFQSRSLEIQPKEGEPIDITVEEKDEIRLDQTPIGFEEFRKGDRVEIKYGDGFKIIVVTRNKAEHAEQVLASINLSARMIRLADDAGSSPALEVFVPPDILVQLNDEPSDLSKLMKGDRVVVEHVKGDNHRVAKSVTALRLLSMEGTVESFRIGPPAKLTLLIEDSDGPPKTFTVAADCKVTLNNQSQSEGQLLSIVHLKAKDRVQIQYDSRIRAIAAFRAFRDEGIVKSVSAGKLIVAIGDPPKNVEVSLKPEGKIEGLPVESANRIEFIRPGDHVTIDHASATRKNLMANAIAVKPIKNPRTWAIVITQHDYVDSKLPQLDRLAADSQLVRDALVGFYRVPEERVMMATNLIRLSLFKQLRQRLTQIADAVADESASAQLIVVFFGYGMVDEDNTPLLATRDFDSENPQGTALKLRDLIQLIEQCQVGERILLLDTCHYETDLATGELPAALLKSSERRVSVSVDVVASTSKGEHGQLLGGDGAFASIVANGLKGQADGNGDNFISSDELFDFKNRRITQTPQRFLPDATPPRLTKETREAVEQLLGFLTVPRIDETSLSTVYGYAQFLQPKEPDVDIAYGLAQLKLGRTADAQRVFEKLAIAHPKHLVPNHALAWQYFLQGNHDQSIAALAKLVNSLPKPLEGDEYDAYAQHVLHFAGVLRQFGVSSLGLTFDKTKPLDTAIKQRADGAEAFFRKGVTSVRTKFDQLNQKLRNTTDPTEQAALRRDLRRLSFYTAFDFKVISAAVRAGLER